MTEGAIVHPTAKPATAVLTPLASCLPLPDNGARKSGPWEKVCAILQRKESFLLQKCAGEREWSHGLGTELRGIGAEGDHTIWTRWRNHWGLEILISSRYDMLRQQVEAQPLRFGASHNTVRLISVVSRHPQWTSLILPLCPSCLLHFFGFGCSCCQCRIGVRAIFVGGLETGILEALRPSNPLNTPLPPPTTSFPCQHWHAAILCAKPSRGGEL